LIRKAKCFRDHRKEHASARWHIWYDAPTPKYDTIIELMFDTASHTVKHNTILLVSTDLNLQSRSCGCI
jgi:hypothetical protein